MAEQDVIDALKNKRTELTHLIHRTEAQGTF
jgi:hypothetical protein